MAFADIFAQKMRCRLPDGYDSKAHCSQWTSASVSVDSPEGLKAELTDGTAMLPSACHDDARAVVRPTLRHRASDSSMNQLPYRAAGTVRAGRMQMLVTPNAMTLLDVKTYQLNSPAANPDKFTAAKFVQAATSSCPS